MDKAEFLFNGSKYIVDYAPGLSHKRSYALFNSRGDWVGNVTAEEGETAKEVALRLSA
jgi:hypothetical protein